jgi:hypothetical protein
MATTWDLTDVPPVDVADLAAAMRALIEAGRGLVLFNGATEGDLETVRGTLQRRHPAEPHKAVAAFVRFRNLVDVFAARRFREMLLGTGYALMTPAVAIAATQRINAHRGFNPQRFLLALNAALADNIVSIDRRPGGTPAGERRIAA